MSTLFDRIELRSSGGATAELLHYGAQLVSWRPAARPTEHLFMSEKARFEQGTAIRGGVPVVFPQFSDRGELPKHGLVRVRDWRRVSHTRLADGSDQLVMALTDDSETRKLWPHPFALSYTLTLSDNSLLMTLEVTNTGPEGFAFTGGLHTYFAVGEIRGVKLFGLTGSSYQDDGKGPVQPERRQAVTFGKPVDRVYHLSEKPLRLQSPAQDTEIYGDGFSETVVWNPGSEASKLLQDMADDGYREMLCIEAATLLNPVTLAPGASWRGSQRLTARGN